MLTTTLLNSFLNNTILSLENYLTIKGHWGLGIDNSRHPNSSPPIPPRDSNRINKIIASIHFENTDYDDFSNPLFDVCPGIL
jgi:hypothetical protein